MTKHYILTLNPNAQYEWDHCILRDPITDQRPDLEGLIAQAVEEATGSYLIAVNIEVKVLEKGSIPQNSKLPVETSAVAVNRQRSELVA
ncbi:MAG: hypothetical protein F6K36_20015 [Symploca sp. SIO3C6]|uniref:Uncharacterized protein n=1 Tax=Symploca sp. SIO1C4 TaxID=2607765 RepID=A0A6B3N9L6_9CYAN|nr:hypothetical protein [Symploca sp. SIO3C6]NER28357.1 hypothetical protein [Symploca sp. SIO1C4]NET08318.1 hypothetical protein [Symploca sp. SIO2B6]NET53126.1 hypothetical protein [Merismopedia sp. SIO2A8]